MAIDPGTGYLIGTGVSAAISGGNTYSTGRMNKKNREWAEKMYDKQKEDSKEFWRMQNEYNSPQQQMNRLRQAGLNPNLVYGKGAETTAGAISTPKAMNYQGEAPQFNFDAQGAFQGYQQTQLRQEQTDNIAKQNEYLDLKKDMEAMKITGQGIQNSKDQITKNLAMDTYQSQVQNWSLKNQLMEQSKLTRELDNQYKAGVLSPNVEKAYVQLKNEKLQTANIELKNVNTDLQNAKLKLEQTTEKLEQDKLQKEIEMYSFKKELAISTIAKLEADTGKTEIQTEIENYKMKLRSMGLNDSDPGFMRMVSQFMFNSYQVGEQVYNKVKGTTYRGASGSW